MKHQILTLAFFLFIGITTRTFAQQNDSTTIKIILPTTEDWKIADTVSLENFHAIFSELKTIIYFERVDSIKNEWVTKIPISRADLYYLSVKRKKYNYLLIFPNDEIEVLFNEEGKYTFSKSKLSKEYQTTFNNQNKYSYSDFVKYEWQEYVEKVDSLIKQEISDYELAFQSEKPNPIFDAYFRNKVVSSHNYAFGYYPFFHNRHHKKKEMVAILPEEYFDAEPKVPYTIPSSLEEDYPYTSDYIRGVSNTLAKEGNCDAEQGKVYDFENYHCVYQNTSKISTSQLKKMMALNSLEGMIKKIEWSNLSQTEIIDKAFMSLENEFPNDEDVLFLKEKTKNIKRFAKGQPATNFTLKDKNGKIVSLSDFKGKYVLIDFFSAWCKPCIAERPYSEKLETEFADKNIVFLNVCIDSKESIWKKVLDKIPLEGTELYAEDKESKEIREAYNIEGASAYFFLDKDGNFISINARPSQNAKRIIEKALAEDK